MGELLVPVTLILKYGRGTGLRICKECIIWLFTGLPKRYSEEKVIERRNLFNANKAEKGGIFLLGTALIFLS